jgi:hypothetical protein
MISAAAVSAPAASAVTRTSAIRYAPPSGAGQPLNERFRGVNWARNGDNFTTGALLQDGLDPADSYSTAFLKSTQILSSLIATLHINTVRLGINEASVDGSWWPEYQAVVQAATDLHMNVILGFWSPSNSSPGSVVPCTDGTFTGCYPVSDYTPWWEMWQTIITTFASYGNVYLEPFNEAAGYSDLATGYEGPSPTQLSDLDAAWLARYPRFPRGRVILGGSGDDYYLTLGHDPRLDGTLLSYHPYCSFGLDFSPNQAADGTSTAAAAENFPTEAAWTQWIKGQIAGMESRTVITEFGLGVGTANYDGARDGNNCVSYVYAVTDYARAHHIGLVFWEYGGEDNGFSPGSWSIETRTGDGTAASPYVTHITNQSLVDRLEWGFGFDDPLTPTVSSQPDATFYTSGAPDRFTVQTTGYPAARLTASGAGGTALPAGVRFTSHGDGTGTLSGDAASGRLAPGTYPLTITAASSAGTSTQAFTLTVAAGPPPAPATGVIAGRITDASGRPLAGVCAHVFVASSLTNYDGNNYAPAAYQACSGPDGRYSIPGVIPGSAYYDVQFIDSDARYLPQWHGAPGPGTTAVLGYDHPGTPVSVTAAAWATVNATMRPIPSGITVSAPARTADGRWAVSGTITVTNYNNVPLTGVTVTDSVSDSRAVCTVTGGTGVTIAASPQYPGALTTAAFPYTCRYPAPPPRTSETESATARWTPSPNIPNDSYEYTQSFRG